MQDENTLLTASYCGRIVKLNSADVYSKLTLVLDHRSDKVKVCVEA